VKGRSRGVRFGAFIVGGLAFALALAFLVSPSASHDPDGLNKVAMDKGLADAETDHALDDAPTAGYQVRGVDDERLSTGRRHRGGGHVRGGGWRDVDGSAGAPVDSGPRRTAIGGRP
jgi:hypothetical protein